MSNKESIENIKNILQTGMTVAQLIEALQRCPSKAVVCFRSGYGDYHDTQQALPIEDIEEITSNHMEESGYSYSGISLKMKDGEIVTSTEDDEYDDDDEKIVDDDPYDVVILS